MKFNLKTALIILVTVCVGLGTVTCSDTASKALGTKAAMTMLSIGSQDIPKKEIKKAIPGSDWDQGIVVLTEANAGRAEFRKESDITVTRIKPIVSKGARAEWGIGTQTVRPTEFQDVRVPATFENSEYIYIKVTSEDLQTVNYYAFYANVFSWVTDLASVTIAGRTADATGGADAFDNPTIGAADISITIGESKEATVEAATFDPNATVRFGKAKGIDAPAFQSKDTPITFDDQDYLYIEVTAENTIDKKYFRYRVHVGRMATVKELTFTGGAKGKVTLYSKGLPKPVWGDVAPGEYSVAVADQPAGGFNIGITLDDPDGTVVYQIVSSIASVPSTFDSTTRAFDNGDYLVIRVNSVNGGQFNYYKIQVKLLAANITKQPKSGWYLRKAPGGKGDPLTITLDPPDTGQYTYQWYEADSLFGFYGRHGMSLDEKNNISTINGGPDMYYYLSQPDIDQYGDPAPMSSYDQNNPKAMAPLAWKIDGATSSTYEPYVDWVDVPIKLPKNSSQNNSFPYVPSSSSYTTGETDKAEPDGGWPTPARNHVNFITGSTSEVRYYWVEVTDTGSGLKVTSDRAVILTETDDEVHHFIFELSDLPIRKNPAPFTYLRELYKINIPPNYFPEGFDPSNYGNCIAQAQYFLPDGRPWTQNWTHGDLHFGYTEGSDSYEKNGGPLTWWHNNLGSNSGAIPLQSPHSNQGGLSFPPDWVGFAPSGDPKRSPPLDSRTGKLPIGYKPTGYPEGQAQGYFCGFIELMELRFNDAAKK